MSIVLVGSTSGSVTLQEPAVSGSTVIDLPATSGTMVVTGGAQTVQFAAGSASTPSITFTGDTNTGIFSPGADTIAFTEGGTESMRITSSGDLFIKNNSNLQWSEYSAGTSGVIWTGHGTNNNLDAYTTGTLRMRIDSSGNVGIGTTSPTKLLTVLKTQNAETSILVRNQVTGTAGKAIIRFGNDNSDDVGSVGALSSAFTPSGALEADGFYVDSGRQSLNLSASNSGTIKFFGTGTERMRMSGSTLFIGATSSPSGTQRLVLTADGNAGTEPLLINELRAGNSNENAIRFYRNGSQVGTITTNASNTSYNTSSDYRLKENIAPMTGALAKVAQLKPCTYTWKVDGSDGQGFIAHELAEVVAGCVTGEKDGMRTEKYEVSPAIPATYDEEGNELTPAVEAVMGEREVPDYQGIDTSFLVATLTAAIQEQQAIITDLKARIETLENK